MRANLLKTLLVCNAAIALASPIASAQAKPHIRPGLGQGLQPRVPPPAPPAASAAPAVTADSSPATAPPGSPPGAAPVFPPTIGPNGKPIGDTQGLTQFESGVEYEPRPGGERVSFSLEDADLPELVRVIGELTGKRFIFGGKVRNIKATVFSPQKVTVAEAYQAFLSILDANGLTVVPHGRFYKIIDSPDAKMGAPVYVAGQGGPPEDRYITRLHRLRNVNAEEVANVLGHFKSKDGDIVVYGPGNLLIITDTGTNIQRMMRILEDVDIAGVGEQIWIEPIHYGSASDIAQRLEEVFDVKSSAAAAGGKPGEAKPGGASVGGDVHVSKILSDDRSNSLVIIATERAYLRILEFVKRLDVPANIAGGEIHVVMLQHADAVELGKTLNDIISGAQAAGGAAPAAGSKGVGNSPLEIFESRVKVSSDKATNSIVVTSSLRDFANLRTVIDQLDQPRRQVFIEAVIMDLTIDRENQFGMAFNGGAAPSTTIGSTAGQTLLYGGLNPFRSILLPSPTDSTLNAFALGVRGPGLPGSENLLGTGFSIPAFGILINALASTNDADILSTPHILATDNIPAEINVGQNIPLQTNSAGFGGIPGLGGAASGAAGALGALGGLAGGGGIAPRQDIGTKIKITPHLNDSDEVRLEVAEEISDITGQQPIGSLGVVPFAKRTATTQLVVKDQQTIVIGGLMRSRVARTDTKIPLLGDIPVLGALFRSRSSTLQKSNLILVLTPYIVREQADLRIVFERKMQERQEFLDHYFVFAEQNNYEAPKDYSRMTGLLEDIRQSYFDVDEQRRLEDLQRPREIKTHEPGQPLELPGPITVDGMTTAPEENAAPARAPRSTTERAAAGGPAAVDRSPPPPATLNVAPPARNVEKTEH
jgi:general secretion pathway protein D